MKASLYPRLAVGGISKNKRIYYPYILTCVIMVMMYYIVGFLQRSQIILTMPGADVIKSVLAFGGNVISVFACIFLFYTNSLLMKRRRREFGLYNILGMGKRHIAHILVWESIIIAVVSLALGLLLGTGLSKLVELVFVNFMDFDINYTFEVSSGAIIMTAIVFSIIFLLIFLSSLINIRFSSAISLLRSENVGERPPKGNWFLGLIGAGTLAAAYYIAVSVADPFSAFGWFTVAVIMVIVATYLLMISGSVVFCRLLKKNKSYYYKSNHFVSVSSMIYRMKRNGAGLASICILVTMVLVIISTTTSLFFGINDSVARKYPKEMNISLLSDDYYGIRDERITKVKERFRNIMDKYSFKEQSVVDYRRIEAVGIQKNGNILLDQKLNEDDYSYIRYLYFITDEDYNRVMGDSVTLEDDEVMLYPLRTKYDDDTISFGENRSFKVRRILDDFAVGANANDSTMAYIVVIVPDFTESLSGIISFTDTAKDIGFRWIYNFDTGLDKEQQIKLTNELEESYKEYNAADKHYLESIVFQNREIERDGFYDVYGSLFLIGIILSIVFILAAVLIIYYKQISEGYEDAARFEIMQKVGMTKREIKRSINSQLLTVFFLPLLFAGSHLAFASPLIKKMLELNNVNMFVVTVLISFSVFALFYAAVYRITSNAYYKIVSGAKAKK